MKAIYLCLLIALSCLVKVGTAHGVGSKNSTSIRLSCRISITATIFSTWTDKYSEGDGYTCKERACAMAVKQGAYVHFVSNSLDDRYNFGYSGDCNSNGVPEIFSVHGSLPGLN
jgi:hypothetical protein